MEAIFFGGLGLIIGSFLNVLIFREGTEEGIGGRSHCQNCKHVLSIGDLVPVFSWLWLRGKCRYCTAPLSPQYPLVEILTSVLFVLVGMTALPISLLFLACGVVSICIAIAVYDLRHLLMPDAWNYTFLALAFIVGLQNVTSFGDVLFHIAAGIGTAFPLWMLWFMSNGAWMGYGDVKFSLGIGWLLGFQAGFTALLGAFIFGAVVSVCILLPMNAVLSYAQTHGITWLRVEGKHFTMKSEVPFGPFLIASCLTIWFLTLYGIEIPLA